MHPPSSPCPPSCDSSPASLTNACSHKGMRFFMQTSCQCRMCKRCANAPRSRSHAVIPLHTPYRAIRVPTRQKGTKIPVCHQLPLPRRENAVENAVLRCHTRVRIKRRFENGTTHFKNGVVKTARRIVGRAMPLPKMFSIGMPNVLRNGCQSSMIHTCPLLPACACEGPIEGGFCGMELRRTACDDHRLH